MNNTQFTFSINQNQIDEIVSKCDVDAETVENAVQSLVELRSSMYGTELEKMINFMLKVCDTLIINTEE